MMMPFARRVREDVFCTVSVVNTFDSLAAHVELDGNVTVEPGDEVLVHGNPMIVPYGENPAFFAGLERLRKFAQRGAPGAAAGVAFVRLFLIPTKSNTLPADIRLAPTW